MEGKWDGNTRRNESFNFLMYPDGRRSSVIELTMIYYDSKRISFESVTDLENQSG